MPKSLIVKVEPKVLTGLRESSGWTIEEIAKRLKTDPNVISKLESGKGDPTLRQLEVMSSSYKYPLAAFLLSEPKMQKPLPKDYRFLSGKQGVFDKKTLLAIRRSRYLQEIGRELSLNINSETKPKISEVVVEHNSGTIAAKYRKVFDLSQEKQQKFRDAYQLFNYLRKKLESLNILVFQFSIPIEDARGFTLVDYAPSVIAVSSKDKIEARLFTLMHEFGHILLGESTIDMPESTIDMPESQLAKYRIERWCDKFAVEFLLPDNIAKDLLWDKKLELTDTETLNKLSKTFKVSKAFLLRKMLDLDLITKTTFQNTLDRYRPKNQNKKSKSKNSIRIMPDKRCLSEVGSKFVWLVANNFDKKIITYTDALGYLSIKSKNFDKVLSRI